MKTKTVFLLTLLVTIVSGTRVMAANEEAYAVYTSADRTLAFYYDNKKSDREGDKYGVNNGYLIPGWIYDGKQFERVVFSGSFASYRPTSTNMWFSGQTELKTITNIKNLKTDNVETMSSMFDQCSRLKEVDVSGFNTANVKYMSKMFYGCDSLKVLGTSGWNTSKVTDMSLMFYKCHELTTVDVSGWDTSNVTDMGSMFSECHKLTTLDVSGWDTSNVTNMRALFFSCGKLTELNVSYWKTSNVTDMTGTFSNCGSLTRLDLGNWDTGKVTNMHNMFNYCKLLTSLDLGGWDTSKVTDMGRMFNDCYSLTTIYAGAGWNTEDVTDQEDMFANCYNLRGSSSTTYDSNHTDGTYAHIDGGPSNPGYFSVRGYSLWVGGTEVTSVNYESLPVMSGSASYDIPNKTLTLTNAIINVNAQGGYCIANGLSAEQRVQGIDGLKIEVIGRCQLNGYDIALMINGNTTLTGTGRLELNGLDAIWIENRKVLTVAVKDFYATATQEVIYGNNGGLTVDGTKINSFVCKPKTPNWRYVTIIGLSMTMNDCHFADPEGPWSSGDVEKFNYWNGYYMRYGTMQYCDKVVIEPDSKPVKYRLWVGGIRVTSANKNNIGVDSGTASYDPTTHTLTLNNAIIDAGSSDGISNGLANLEGMSDFKIVCKGTNNIVDALNSDGYGLALYGNTTINGSPLGITAFERGIFTGNEISLTLQDADVYTDAIYPIYSNYGVINVNHSRLKAVPTEEKRKSPVWGASEFNMNDCAFANPGGLNIDPQHLYYDNDEQILQMCYAGGPHLDPILIVPTQISVSTNISEVKGQRDAVKGQRDVRYNLSGQRVGKNYKGIVIHNGKKVVIK